MKHLKHGRPGRRALGSRIARTLVLALALMAVIGPAAAQAYSSTITKTVDDTGAKATVTIWHHADGSLAASGTLYDTKGDYQCAHVSVAWYHDNGSVYYDRDYFCGAGQSKWFDFPSRNGNYYWKVSAAAYRDWEETITYYGIASITGGGNLTPWY